MLVSAAVGGSVTNGAFGVHGYVGLLERWLREALPLRPHPFVIGSAVSGATLEFNSKCALFAREPDLVIFEHAINLGAGTEGHMPGAVFEGLLRSFLGKRSRPALLMLNWFQSPVGRCGTGPGQAPPAKCKFDHPSQSGEGRFDTLTRYYALPAFSFNAALFEMMQRSDARCGGCTGAQNDIFADGRHPTPAGYTFMGRGLS